jgi:hypothetical protein
VSFTDTEATQSWESEHGLPERPFDLFDPSGKAP